MTMTDKELADRIPGLRAIAEAAAREQWRPGMDVSGTAMIFLPRVTDPIARFVTELNPKTVLALLTRIDQLSARVAALEAEPDGRGLAIQLDTMVKIAAVRERKFAECRIQRDEAQSALAAERATRGELIAAETEACAALAADFDWRLPLNKTKAANEASDNAAETVKRQIAAAIRSRTVLHSPEGKQTEAEAK